MLAKNSKKTREKIFKWHKRALKILVEGELTTKNAQPQRVPNFLEGMPPDPSSVGMLCKPCVLRTQCEYAPVSLESLIQMGLSAFAILPTGLLGPQKEWSNETCDQS